MGRLIRCWAALAVAALVGLTAWATGPAQHLGLVVRSVPP